MKKTLLVKPEVFSLKELKQYEELILDNKNVTEREASQFFTQFPKFLSVGGYAEITREIVLYKNDGKPIYRVDFCRRKLGDKFWDFVELKSPKKPFIVKRGRHWKFSSDIEAGLHQAQNYRDFLEEDLNRLELEKRYGIKAFRPKILLIGGRFDDRIDPISLKKLISRYNNADIQSYDDIYNFAIENFRTSFIVIPIIQEWKIPFFHLEPKNNLKSIRYSEALFMTELAHRAKLSVKTIQRIENQMRTSYVSKYKIAKALGKSIEEVFPKLSDL